MVGILTVCFYEARVLIDLGATYSFISPIFALRLGKNPTALECALFIAAPLSDNRDADMVFLGSQVVVDGKILSVDLVPVALLTRLQCSRARYATQCAGTPYLIS